MSEDGKPCEEPGAEPAAEPAAPVTADEHKAQGNELYKAKDFPGAIECYSRAIEAAPGVPTYYSNRSAAWQASGRLANCLEDCVKAVELDPAFRKCLDRGFKVAGALGKLELAVQFAEKLVAVDSEQQGTLELIQKQKQLYADAEEAFGAEDFQGTLSALAEIEDGGLRFRGLVLMQAECCLALGNYSHAQRLTLQLIRENSDDVDAYTLRGMALYYCDNMDQAVKHLQEALRRDPEHKRAMKQLKTVRGLHRLAKEIKEFMFKRDFGEAADRLTQALNLDLLFGLRLQFISDRAVCYLRTFQDDQCIADCTEALRMQPDNISAYMHQEDYEAAVELAERVVEIASNEDAYKRLNEIKFEQKKALRPDYYGMLEVSKVASIKEIKEGYHKQALAMHPDKHPEDREAAEEAFKTMQIAYEVLSNPEMKELYDKGHDYDGIQEIIQRKAQRSGGG